MKRTTNKTKLFFIVSVFLLCVITGIARNPSDSVKVITPSLTLNYLYNSNDTVYLTANISIKRESGFFSLENAGIEFLAEANKISSLLGKTVTDYEGNTIFKFPLKKGVPVDKDGKTTYTAHFAGKGEYLAVTSDAVTARLAKITVNFSTKDSVRYIDVNAYDIGNRTGIRPLPKAKVIVYVPRLFNLLKIGEIELDEKGSGKIEYPGKLVGDSLGKITVIAKIEENDLYGNVMGQQTINWAISKFFYKAEQPTRELWTPIAPIWMIVTLITMLTGVWAHYIYAVIQLIMIKRHSKPKKEYL
jgi:hypothetical protein